MRQQSYQAMARGADGVMFFQWRASVAGAEKFHSAMLPHVGTDSRVWREVSSLGAELKKLDGVLSSCMQVETAILFDWENWWALEREGKVSNDIRLLPQVKSIYAELFRRNISVDFAHPESDLSSYRLVIVPNLFMVSDRAAQNIEQYVTQGGTLLMTFFSGIVDSHDHVRPGRIPAPFSALLGLWIEEFVAYQEEQTNVVETLDGTNYPCELWSDIIHLTPSAGTGAEVLGRFREDYFAGQPAITCHRFEKGTSYYLGTSLNQEGLAWLLELVCTEAGVDPTLKTPAGVEVTSRSDGTHTWLFLLNHSGEEVRVALPAQVVDLLSGKTLNSRLALEQHGVAILQIV
jgi:beta-galactosidase